MSNRIWFRSDAETIALLDELAKKVRVLVGAPETGARSAAMRMAIRHTAASYGLVVPEQCAPEVTAR